MPERNLPAIAGEYTKNLLYTRFIDTSESELKSANQPNEEWNGRLLMNPAGTIWVVMDGVARGYENAGLFDRVHGYRRRTRACGGPLGTPCDWVWRPAVFHRIPSISVIKEGNLISPDATIISNPAGTMFFFENNKIRGVPSAGIMEKYQFNWETGKANVYDDEVIMRLESQGIFE